MKKTIIQILVLTGVFALASFGLNAQQTPQYSLYVLNPYAVNPAYSGLDNTLVVTGVYRKQWTNLRGAPETQHLNAHLPIPIIQSGIGVKVEIDRIGAHRTIASVLSYSYHQPLGRFAKLSGGISVGYLQYSLDGNLLRAPEGQYAEPAMFTHNDALLPEGTVQMGATIVEGGLFLQVKRFQAGISALPAYAPLLKASAPEMLNLKPTQHYYFYSAYDITAGSELDIRPALLAKFEGRETQIEISGILTWREAYRIGASYRGFTSTSRDAAVIIAGIRLNDNTSLAYAFDVPLSALSAINRGSHELLLRYSLNRPIGVGKLPPIIFNPRFF